MKIHQVKQELVNDIIARMFKDLKAYQDWKGFNVELVLLYDLNLVSYDEVTYWTKGW